MFSKLLRWEVFNFMSITHGICEFDERNIVNIKGYNDSGKSAMCTALRVLMCNLNPSKQVDFIQDDKEYFRILAYFDDGVIIMRDKYINGASLYEMHKDGQCIFTTKSKSGALTRISEVPQPIADYLGLIVYDSICINMRSCFEKQIGVQSTGSENYKMFNTVLKSEELAAAGEMINSDRNKLQADINAYNSELNAQKVLLGTSGELTKELVDFLRSLDSELNVSLSCEAELSGISQTIDSINALSASITPELSIVDGTELSELTAIDNLYQELSGVVVNPELPVIDDYQLSLLDNIASVNNELSGIIEYPELSVIDNSQLSLLSEIEHVVNELNGIVVQPVMPEVNVQQLNSLLVVQDIIKSIEECDNDTAVYTKQFEEVSAELDDLKRQIENFGIKMVKCPDCGRVFNPDDTNHAHA